MQELSADHQGLGARGEDRGLWDGAGHLPRRLLQAAATPSREPRESFMQSNLLNFNRARALSPATMAA